MTQLSTCGAILLAVVVYLVLLLLMTMMKKSEPFTRRQNTEDIALGLGTSMGEARRDIRVSNRELAESEGLPAANAKYM
jgi:cell division protein FtsN